MKALDLITTLQQIGKDYYSLADLEKITGLSRQSLRIAVHRWTKRGLLIRMGRGQYRLYSTAPSVERLALALYPPCYLSFEWALARYGLLNLIPYVITLATPRKSKRLVLSEQAVEYRQLKRSLFFGYRITDGLAIATPEKALLDQLYLVSRGKATLDESELNLKGLSKTRLLTDSRSFPSSTQRYVKEFSKRCWGKTSITIE